MLIKLLVALLVFGGLAATLSACDPDHKCPDGDICLWKDTNFTGLHQNFAGGSTNLNYRDQHWDGGTATDDQVDNDASSIINDSGEWVIFYQDLSGQGRKGCMGPLSSIDRLGQWVITPIPNTTMDNKLSGHRSVGTTKPSGCDFYVDAGTDA